MGCGCQQRSLSLNNSTRYKLAAEEEEEAEADEEEAAAAAVVEEAEKQLSWC